MFKLSKQRLIQYLVSVTFNPMITNYCSRDQKYNHQVFPQEIKFIIVQM